MASLQIPPKDKKCHAEWPFAAAAPEHKYALSGFLVSAAALCDWAMLEKLRPRMEGEVASAIAEQLNAKLTGAEEKAVTDKPTQNTAAYDAYLRGISI